MIGKEIGRSFSGSHGKRNVADVGGLQDGTPVRLHDGQVYID